MVAGFTKDLVLGATLVGVGIILIFALYILATFAYSVSERSLVLRWRILGGAPFSSREIELTDIQDAHAFDPKSDFLGGFIFGNVPRRSVVTVVLRRRLAQFLLMKRVFITPDDPASFLAQLARAREVGRGMFGPLVRRKGDCN